MPLITMHYALTMRRYAPNYHALCPHYQAPGIIEKYDTQGIRPYALCVWSSAAVGGFEFLLVLGGCKRQSEASGLEVVGMNGCA